MFIIIIKQINKGKLYEIIVYIQKNNRNTNTINLIESI